MKLRGGRNWATRGHPGVGSDNLLACTRFRTDTEYLNEDGGTNSQPWYRLRHIGTGLGLEGRVGGEPLVEEQAGFVPELPKELLDTLDRGATGDPLTLGIQRGGANVSLHAVFVLTIPPLFAWVIAQHNSTLLCSYRRGVGIPAGRIRALQAVLAKSGRLRSLWWDVSGSLLGGRGSGGGLNWLRGDNWRSGGGWGLRLGVGLFFTLGFLSAVTRASSPYILWLVPLLVWRNETVVHSVRHTHFLEPRLAGHETTRWDHSHSSSHLGHHCHLIHHHLLEN